MRPRAPLWARFALAMMLVVLVLGAGFFVTAERFVHTLEVELLERRVAEELEELVNAYMRVGGSAQVIGSALRSYVVQPGVSTEAPPCILDLGPGTHSDVIIDGVEYQVGRADVGDTHLYVLLNIEPVEALEARLVVLAWVWSIVAVGVSASAAVALSRLVSRPVSQLTRMVARLDPRQRKVSLRAQFGDREIGQIASAFDRYLERLDAFVEREQAFTEDASHELRTPLAIVLSSTQLLRDDVAISAQARQRVLRIERAARQMQELLEALLFLAREDGGACPSDCAIDEVLQEVVESQREVLAARDVRIDLQVATPQRVNAPCGMVASVLNNLVVNALNHAGCGEVSVRLEAGRVIVQDTGAGIEARDLAHIFERRYRGARTGGLGLGLYIVKRICDRLGWTIAVRSAPGAGTCVEIGFSARS